MISFSLFAPLLFNCLVIIGIWKIFSDGMILEKAGNQMQAYLGEYMSKPVITCPPCMASIHGTWFYFAFVGDAGQWHDLAFWPVYLLALCGLNVIAMAGISFLMNDK